jgi:hypothetical protein
MPSRNKNIITGSGRYLLTTQSMRIDSGRLGRTQKKTIQIRTPLGKAIKLDRLTRVILKVHRT